MHDHQLYTRCMTLFTRLQEAKRVANGRQFYAPGGTRLISYQAQPEVGEFFLFDPGSVMFGAANFEIYLGGTNGFIRVNHRGVAERDVPRKRAAEAALDQFLVQNNA